MSYVNKMVCLKISKTVIDNLLEKKMLDISNLIAESSTAQITTNVCFAP